MTTPPSPSGLKLLSRISGFTWRDYLIALVVAATFAVLLTLGGQVANRMAALRAASQDNAQWNLAQLDVELLALDVAIQRAREPSGSSLAELRRRFNVFYSRVNTIHRTAIFTDNLVQPESVESMKAIKSDLEELVPLVDGPDAALQAKLPQFMSAVDVMRPLSRQIGLDGVRIYATQSDAKRNEFARVLGQIAIVNGLLILALGAAMLFLMRQIKISRRRTGELEVVSDRNASTVNSALDAIIAIDMDGIIVEFNPAASKIFGYSRNAAIGAKLDELVVPERFREAHRKGMERYRATGQKHVIDAGRVEMSALKADGTEFPVEFSLGETHAKDGQLIIAFLRDISQRVEQDKELRAARDEALEASKAKSQFLAIMSHEMRTPLNGVMAILDLLGATKLSNKQQTYVKTASTSAEILKQHVDDVLDLTRIQAGKLEFFLRAFNLVELLEEIENINLAMAATRGNRITLNVDMPEPYFIGDRKRIHQVLTNLVGNAIKFTEKGRIDISAKFLNVKADIVTIEFSVSDTGVGIAEDQQARIFEDFVTLDASYQRNVAGAGLGLPICKSIVEAMNGEIGVKSRSGEGSRFWFRLPLKSAFGADEPSTGQRSRKEQAKARKRLKVLVVEDNETNRFVAAEMLQAANCDVALASDGKEGVNLAKAQKFDLILMDLSMPKMNGWDAARLIRSRSSSKSGHSPIFALTAHALPEEQKALHDAGMRGCILKPLRSKALNEILSTLRASGGRNLAESHPLIDASAKIDQTVLEELRDVLGTTTFQEKLYRLLQELKLSVSLLKREARSGHLDELAHSAHKLAGSAAVFGATSLSSELRQLESAARQRNGRLVGQQLKRTVEAIGQTEDELSYFVKSSMSLN